MRYVVLRRVALGIAGGLALAALGYAALLSRSNLAAPTVADAGVVAGEQEFAQHCARCHEVAELRLPDRTVPAVTELVGFLERHGNAPLEDDVAIAGFLSAPPAVELR